MLPANMLGETTSNTPLVLVDPFALQPQQRQTLLPLGLALFAVRHLDLRVAIVVALNDPFEAEVDQRGMVDDELARLDLDDHRLRRGPVAKAGRCEHGQRDEQRHLFHSTISIHRLPVCGNLIVYG